MVVERRQLLMGGAVVVVLVIAVMLLRPASPAPATPAQVRTQPARAKSAKDAQTPGPVAPVKLKELADTREQPGDATRNPFRFKPKPAPPAPPPPKVTTPTLTPGESTRPAPIPAQSGPPPISLKLIGILERANGVKWAVLSDGKVATPYYGKDGDIIDGRWQIVKIGTESIEMTYVDGKGKTVIRLTGQ